jgi:hypothetical protein
MFWCVPLWQVCDQIVVGSDHVRPKSRERRKYPEASSG